MKSVQLPVCPLTRVRMHRTRPRPHLPELHSYYHEIEPHTFKTTFVPVSVEAADAWRVGNRGGVLTPDQQQHLQTLKDVVDEHVTTTFGGRCFIRLSTRSPKDAIDKVPALRAELVRYLRERLGEVQARGEEVDGNAKLCALNDSMAPLMAVSSSSEFFELVACSSRCVSDIVRCLDYKDDLPSWDLQCIVREFHPVPSSSEFRCFVKDRRLVAISQYFATCFYPDVAERADEYRVRIVDFFEAACGAITLDEYIIDMAVMPDSDRVHIIELNPFAQTTGPCLFDWSEDRALLHGEGDAGTLPAIRVVRSAQAHLDVALLPWADLFAEAGFPATQETSPAPPARAGSERPAPRCSVQ